MIVESQRPVLIKGTIRAPTGKHCLLQLLPWTDCIARLQEVYCSDNILLKGRAQDKEDSGLPSAPHWPQIIQKDRIIQGSALNDSGQLPGSTLKARSKSATIWAGVI